MKRFFLPLIKTPLCYNLKKMAIEGTFIRAKTLVIFFHVN